ncbi:MAG: hypothetical protein HYW48_10560 [Deltaproteobacteria bacterium]|nr:hypothetical protein [Deltaproteobacteria bacterium]
MASRLSEETRSGIYNSGCSGLSFDVKLSNLNKFWGDLDLEKLIMRPDLPSLVPQIPIQRLYCALLERGPASYPDILKHLSAEQVQRILDYDAWRNDELVPQQALNWLRLFRNISTEQAYRRLRDLEEEYQIGIFSPFVRVFDNDAYEAMSDEEQDRLYRLPNDALFYCVLSEDKDVHDNIVGLIEAVLAHDINYALSLLCHSAYLPPLESAHLLSQFRKSRLEEDGFVSHEESMTCFAEIDVAKKKALWSRAPLPSLGARARKTGTFFLDEVLSHGAEHLGGESAKEGLQQGFVFLANALCTAVEREADDLAALKTIFTAAKALASLGLEFLSDGNLGLAAQILSKEYPKELFRVGLSLLKSPQRRFLGALVETGGKGGEQAYTYFVQQKHGLLLDWFDRNLRDRIGFEGNEILKGIFNRFPQCPQILPGAEGEDRVTFIPVGSLQDLASVDSLIDIVLRKRICGEDLF